MRDFTAYFLFNVKLLRIVIFRKNNGGTHELLFMGTEQVTVTVSLVIVAVVVGLLTREMFKMELTVLVTSVVVELRTNPRRVPSYTALSTVFRTMCIRPNSNEPSTNMNNIGAAIANSTAYAPRRRFRGRVCLWMVNMVFLSRQIEL